MNSQWAAVVLSKRKELTAPHRRWTGLSTQASLGRRFVAWWDAPLPTAGPYAIRELGFKAVCTCCMAAVSGEGSIQRVNGRVGGPVDRTTGSACLKECLGVR